MQRFTKIRDSGKAVILRYTTEDSEKTTHHHEVESEDRPHPDFVTALQSFKSFAAQLIDVKDEYLAEARVTSVSVRRKGDSRGVVISLVRPCSKTTAPLNIHTPHVKEQVTTSDEEDGDEPGDDAVGVWLPGMDDALTALEEQAIKYVQGMREQGSLFEQPVGAHRSTNGASPDESAEEPPSKRRGRKPAGFTA